MYNDWGNVFGSVKRIFKGRGLHESQFIDKITLLVGVHYSNNKR